MKNRGKQLEALKQMEDRIQRLKVFHEYKDVVFVMINCMIMNYEIIV